MNKFKRIIWIGIFFTITAVVWSQVVPILVIDTPEIVTGNVYNDTYYYGPISIQSNFSNDLNEDTKAYYSLDSGINWDVASTSSISFDTSVGSGDVDFHSPAGLLQNGTLRILSGIRG